MPGNVAVIEYPTDAIPFIYSSGNAAAAIATATVPALPGRTAYISGLQITSSGSTAAAVVLAVLAGLIGGASISYVYTSVAGVTLANPTLQIMFPKPIPASASNTAVTLTLPSLGAGSTNAVATLHGFYL